LIDQDYSENTSEYKNSRKNEYTYDANNNIIFWARYLWASFTDMNYEWIKTSDNSYVYDSNNQETERLTRILFQNIITYEYEMTNSRKLINVWEENGMPRMTMVTPLVQEDIYISYRQKTLLRSERWSY